MQRFIGPLVGTFDANGKTSIALSPTFPYWWDVARLAVSSDSNVKTPTCEILQNGTRVDHTIRGRQNRADFSPVIVVPAGSQLIINWENGDVDSNVALTATVEEYQPARRAHGLM